jgi:hypothetical protein
LSFGVRRIPLPKAVVALVLLIRLQRLTVYIRRFFVFVDFLYRDCDGFKDRAGGSVGTKWTGRHETSSDRR